MHWDRNVASLRMGQANLSRLYDGEATNGGQLMRWRADTLNATVDAEIGAMPPDMQASFLRLAERIEAVGLERIGEPHIKHLRGKLWEMRFNGRDGIGRTIYAAASGRR